MNDRQNFETRLTNLLADYADRAPVEVDPFSMTAAVARRRSRLVWPTFAGRGSWLVIGATIALLALGVALVAGSHLLRPHPPIGGGGLMLINQADWPGSDATRQVTLHVFSLDEATGERVPIVDVPPAGRSYLIASPVWAPDHTHALLTDGAGSVRIIDTANMRVSPIALKPADTYISFADGNAWSRGSDRIATFVSNDTTNIQGSILVSDSTGREITRLSLPSGWSGGRPTWSPDAKSLILMGHADASTDWHLLLVPLDGSPMRVLLEPSAGYGWAVWSPDGTTIAFESPTGIQTMDITIYVVDVDGSNFHQLTSGFDATPIWSADGTMILFGRQAGIYPDVWVIGADGTSPRLLVKNAVADW